MHFDFNERGSYSFTTHTQSQGNRPSPTALAFTQQKGGAENFIVNRHQGTRPNAIYTESDSTKRTWLVTEGDRDAIADAFHYAGLFIERVFPELKEKGIRFVRDEFKVVLMVGDSDDPDTAEQYSSTYSPTRTFKNPHYGGREFPEMNFRSLPKGKEKDAFTSTLYFALNALENYAYEKRLPASGVVQQSSLKPLQGLKPKAVRVA